MIATLLIAAFLAGATPEPIRPGAILRFGDYPNTDFAPRDQGAVIADVMVDPAGRPVSCLIALSTGHERLDQTTCRLIMARARFRPARDEQGAAIASRYRHPFNWLTDRADPGLRPDATLPVSRLPATLKAPVTVVRQVTAADGTVESCAVQSSSGADALDRLACKAAAGMARRGDVTDAAGRPTRGLRGYTIAYTAVQLAPSPVN